MATINRSEWVANRLLKISQQPIAQRTLPQAEKDARFFERLVTLLGLVGVLIIIATQGP
jgi:hypothetical protein